MNRYDLNLQALASDYGSTWLKLPEREEVSCIQDWRTKNRTSTFPKAYTARIDELLDKVALRQAARAGKGGSARVR